MKNAQRRRWRREDEEEIGGLIKWINSPEKYVLSGQKNDGILEMKKADTHKTAFGKRFSKGDWRAYLLSTGAVSESELGTVTRTKLDIVM